MAINTSNKLGKLSNNSILETRAKMSYVATAMSNMSHDDDHDGSPAAPSTSLGLDASVLKKNLRA